MHKAQEMVSVFPVCISDSGLSSSDDRMMGVVDVLVAREQGCSVLDRGLTALFEEGLKDGGEASDA